MYMVEDIVVHNMIYMICLLNAVLAANSSYLYLLSKTGLACTCSHMPFAGAYINMTRGQNINKTQAYSIALEGL